MKEVIEILKEYLKTLPEPLEITITVLVNGTFDVHIYTSAIMSVTLWENTVRNTDKIKWVIHVDEYL